MLYIYNIYIFFKAVIMIMCKFQKNLLKTHFFVEQIFCSHFGSFFGSFIFLYVHIYGNDINLRPIHFFYIYIYIYIYIYVYIYL